ncbi:MAG TPA: cyclase family protein [Methanocella sp.]|nr:cyclase family protein [Methanocella sp.]
MKIFDISVSLYNGMPVFPGDPVPDIKRVMQTPKDPGNVSLLTMGSHTGTHVDPPLHFVHQGLPVDQIPLDHLYGKAEVLDLTGVKEGISADDLQRARPKEKILLFRTKNSGLWKYNDFNKDFVYLDESGARWIVENHIKTIAIDYLSIGKFSDGHTVHHILLDAGVTVVEGVNLSEVSPGAYTFACLPIKIRDGDGAPARTILVKESTANG